MSDAASGVLRAGTARVTITPPVGTYLQGYNRGRPAEGIRDDLYARALVLERGEIRGALVCADILGLEPESVERVRALAHQATGIPEAAICIACSHTHSGPAVMDVIRMDPPDPDYTRTLERHLAGAIAVAARNSQTVRVGFGEGACGFNINRRLPTERGIVMRPNPTGNQDRRVQVVRLDADGTPVAILFRYACHPTCLTGQNLRFSGDYPGAAARTIEGLYGDGTLACFLPGCFGDLRPNLTTAEGGFRGATDAEVEGIGRRLGAEVVRVAEECEVSSDDRLAAGAAVLELPYADLPSEADLRRAIQDAGMEEFTGSILARRDRGGFVGEVQAFALGPITLVALPGEVMNEIGRSIEAALGLDRTVVMAYTNANPGYLCTARAMAEGGYEPTCYVTSYRHPAPYTPDTEHRLRAAARSAARTLA